MADEIYSKDPKLTVHPSSVKYILKHHEKKSVESEKQTISLHPANNKFFDDGSKHTVAVQFAEEEHLPEGVTLVIGNKTQTISNTNREVILTDLYKYGEPIALRVHFDKKWRDQATKNIRLKIGTSNEKGSYTFLKVVLIPKKDDTLFLEPGAEELNYTVPYGEIKKYEVLNTKQFSINSKAAKGIKHNATFSFGNKQMPKGLQFRVNGITMGENFTYQLGVPVELTLYRNNSYKEEKEYSLELKFEDLTVKQEIMIPVNFNPLPRELRIDVNPVHPSVRLDKLKEASEIDVTLYANDKRIANNSFSQYKLKADCGGLKCKLRKDEEQKKFFLKIKPNFILGSTSTGDVPITVQLVEGVYPNDHAEKTFTYTVEDIGWKKWVEPLKWLLLLLLLLWYLWGITGGRKRFKKNQVVRYARIKRGEVQRKDEMDYHLRKKQPWWDVLIPYRAQRHRVEDLEFTATRKRQIYLARNSQALVKYNGLEIEGEGQKDLRLSPSDTLRTDYALYTIQ